MSHMPNGQVRLAATILMWTGVRRSELVRTRRIDYHFDDDYVRIEGKNGEERRAPLHPELVIALDSNAIFQSRKPGDYIITLARSSISDGIRVAKYRSNLQHKRGRTHLLRHSLGVHLINQGYDLRYVQQILGHKTLWQTIRYTKILSKQLTSQFKEFSYSKSD
ncbi:MAG: phage integrase family protein [Gammaproteobacteria bacterium]|nr:phage integrase family protein [Gammaproteobacteria bacterium]